MYRQTDKRTNRQMDEQKSPCVLQDFVPFGSAAQKSKVSITNTMINKLTEPLLDELESHCFIFKQSETSCKISDYLKVLRKIFQMRMLTSIA